MKSVFCVEVHISSKCYGNFKGKIPHFATRGFSIYRILRESVYLWFFERFMIFFLLAELWTDYRPIWVSCLWMYAHEFQILKTFCNFLKKKGFLGVFEKYLEKLESKKKFVRTHEVHSRATYSNLAAIYIELN